VEISFYSVLIQNINNIAYGKYVQKYFFSHKKKKKKKKKNLKNKKL
jgi:hypothetical protein